MSVTGQETSAPRMAHVLEVTARPYSLGNPRRYYAADMSANWGMVHNGVSYQVRDVRGALMFVEVTA